MNPRISRRSALGLGTAALSSGWLSRLAAATGDHPERKRSCILLWMAGGPSQTDTLDPKPEHANGGPFRAVETSIPGIRLGEHLPKVGAQMDRLAVIRSMATKEGDHDRATFHLRTGNMPQGAIEFPTFGSLISKEFQSPDSHLPGFVSIAPRGIRGASLSAGFLGPDYAPLIVEGSGPDEGGNLSVENLELPGGLSQDREKRRSELLGDLERRFLESRPGIATSSHTSAYDGAIRLMRRSAAEAFDLAQEEEALRERYGRNRFGQGCLLARRLVERGVPFVEVTLGGWDTHDDNFTQVARLCGTLDPAWATLMSDLADRGLLETTTVVWMGEFGRTPPINPRSGRDHFPNAWSVALGGGGIAGGKTIGSTTADGLEVADRPVAVPDLLATICLAIGVDPAKQNDSNVNRPIRIVDPSASPVREALA